MTLDQAVQALLAKGLDLTAYGPKEIASHAQHSIPYTVSVGVDEQGRHWATTRKSQPETYIYADTQELALCLLLLDKWETMPDQFNTWSMSWKYQSTHRNPLT